MALRVWLPLTGTLENKGISNIEIINNGTAINDNGKIGKCYNFNGSSNYIKMSPTILTNSSPEFSVCCWFKTASKTSAECLFSQRNAANANGFSIFVYGTTGKILLDDGIRWEITPRALTVDTWYHLTFTRSQTKKAYYINGELVASTTTIGTPTAAGSTSFMAFGSAHNNATTLSGNFMSGCLNDWRLYDHCLSAKEVKEISQGLILHYKLSGFNGGAGENLILNGDAVKNQSYWSNWNTASNRSIETINGKKWFHFKSNTTSYGGYSQNSYGNNYDIPFKPNTTYTVSALMYASASTQMRFWFHMRSSEGGNNISQPVKTFTISTTPQIYTYTFNSGTNASYTIDRFCLMIGSYDAGAANDVYFTDVKIEEGSINTSWTPNSQEIGIDTTKIKDSSGYENDGIQNNITILQDSSRYNYSAVFNGSNSYVKVPNNNWASQGMEAMTINLWAKASSWPTNGGRLLSCTETGGFNLEGGNSGYWRFPVHVYTNTEKTSTAYKYDSKEIQISALTPNDWNMITLVYDTTGTKTYINGQLHHTYTNTSYGIHFNTNARLFLGCEANTANPGGNYFNGQESDFRIYATALSAEDILDLYNTPANIDNLGGIHGFEFIEDNSSISIKKNGQVLLNELDENSFDTNAQFLKTTSNINTKIAIEK